MTTNIHDTTPNTLDILLKNATQQLQQGKLSLAEASVRKLLDIAPDHASGTHLLGIINLQHGRYKPAIELLSRAITLDPLQPSCHNNLAYALHVEGRLLEAQVSCEQAIRLKPDFAEAYNTYAAILRDAGQYANALAACEQANRINPCFAHAYGTRAAILLDMNRPQESISSCKRALELNPNNAEAHNILGVAYKSIGRMEEALTACRKATRIRPDLASAHDNLGSLLHGMGQPFQALAACERALQLNPVSATTYCNHANILGDMGRHDEAESSYRRALELSPDNTLAHSNLLFLLAAYTSVPPEDMFEEQRRWDQAHGAEGRIHRFSARTRRVPSGRRMRIGYVSPDFRAHPVGYFIQPLLAAHDKSRFEIFCYANHTASMSDDITQRLRTYVEHWRFVYDKDDHDMAKLIHEDGIDILVDLAGHTRDNRLKAFTYKPAPIQAAYLGYLASTGLESMDYWITDEILHPGDTPEKSTERIYRLPRCAFCYTAPDLTIPVLPRNEADDQITFASFSHLSKLTPEVIDTWARILKELPDSRLLIMDKFMIEPECRRWIARRFQDHGITSDRLSLRERLPFAHYLSAYAEVDVVLDPFPRTGGTTTAEALWMGVPVITLAGRRYVERISASKLMAVGLQNLVTRSREHYIEAAVSLAQDAALRRQLRTDLRDRMAKSALCDGKGLAQAMETAYLSMWQQFVSAHP